MSWATDFHFEVAPKPEADKFMPKGGWGDVVSPWTVGSAAAQQPVLQAYQTDENLKKQYGIELAKTNNPFEAACKLFSSNDDTSKALWVSFNWLTDPLVVASKDIYLKTLKLSSPPLDREQLAAKVLELAEGEKVERNGVLIPTIDPKERINAFKLYSEILGYTGKVEIDNSTKNTFNHNEMKIVLVKPKALEPVTIETANAKSEVLNANTPSPISLKLVKAS